MIERTSDSITVRRGVAESHQVEVGPSKHASNAVSGAFALADRVIISRAPTILDFQRYTRIYESLGSRTDLTNGVLTMDNSGLNSETPDQDLVKKVRASILLLSGALLKTGRIVMPVPEGDWPGSRPTSSVLGVVEKFGAKISTKEGLIEATLNNPKKLNRIVDVDGKVFATMASMILAAGVGGRTSILKPLSSLEIDNLAGMLSQMGVNVRGLDTKEIIIESEGLSSLKKEVEVNISPDACETMFWLTYAKLHNIHLEIIFPGWEKKIDPAHWGPLFDMSRFMYFTHMIIDGDENRGIVAQQDIKQLEPVDIVAFHDKKGLPRDAAPVLAVLFGVLDALSSYYDDKYGSRRIEWMKELAKIGGDVRYYQPLKATIFGNQKWTYEAKSDNTVLAGSDIRSAAALLLAASTSQMPITVSGLSHIERSYTNLPEKLSKLGTEILEL